VVLGLAGQLKSALAIYTESGGQGSPGHDVAQAIAVMLEKHGIACDMLHGSDWETRLGGTRRSARVEAGEENAQRIARSTGAKANARRCDAFHHAGVPCASG
jgi:Domain of unknown function (DUF3387)